MQQSFGQAKPVKGLGKNKALEASFLSIGYYLSMLRQHFPENCEASEIVTDSLSVLTQINSALNEKNVRLPKLQLILGEDERRVTQVLMRQVKMLNI